MARLNFSILRAYILNKVISANVKFIHVLKFITNYVQCNMFFAISNFWELKSIANKYQNFILVTFLSRWYQVYIQRCMLCHCFKYIFTKYKFVHKFLALTVLVFYMNLEQNSSEWKIQTCYKALICKILHEICDLKLNQIEVKIN